MTTATAPDGRSIVQILFARKKEVEGWPSLVGGQDIKYPARRNPSKIGHLSAMLCKACVVALNGDVLGAWEYKPTGDVCVKSRSQSGGADHLSHLVGQEAYLPRGKVTYHLGLLFLAQALALPRESNDLLDALEELLEHTERVRLPDARHNELLMHLADELYYWARYRDQAPGKGPDRLESLRVLDASSFGYLPTFREVDHKAFTRLDALKRVRGTTLPASPNGNGKWKASSRKFRGPQLEELIESLELGMHCLLVGPTATGKSLCAKEAFEADREGKPVFTIEGHESLREFDLLGGFVPNGEGGFEWRDGVLVRAMRAGGFLFVDEANRMPARTLNVLLGVLSRGAIVLTEHGSEEVEAGEGFQAVMAMNLGQGYSVNALDRALLDRFPCVLEFRYLPSREEEDLLVSETGIDRDVARVMVKVANETRRLRKARELTGELTPRGLIAWAKKYSVKRGSLLARLQAAAKVTWLHHVAGTDADGYLREDAAASLLSLIEAHTPR